MSNITTQSVFVINDLWSFNPNELTVQTTEQTISLRKKNAAVLQTLVNSFGRTVPTETLYEAVWGKKCVSEGVIKRSICDLRNIFCDNDKQMIITVPKQGYRLEAKVKQAELPQHSLDKQTSKDISVATQQFKDRKSTNHEISKPFNKTPLIIGIAFIFAIAITALLLPNKQADNVSYEDSFTSTVFIHEVMKMVKQSPNKAQFLDNLKQKLGSLHEAHPEREVLARQLITASIHAQRFKDVTVLSHKLLRDNEKRYGAQDIRTINTRQFIFDALLSTKQIEAAYEMAKLTLQIVTQNHLNNSSLLAKSYYQFAQINLSCVYPYCDRVESLTTGLTNINLALDLYRQDKVQNPIPYADAQLLKNWFIEKLDEKLHLVSSALETYQRHLGEHDAKTAAAYSQLGKIELHWNKNYQQAELNLTKALSILTTLYGSDYDGAQQLNFELAWLHLEQENFDKAIKFAQLPIDTDDTDFSCLQNLCLKTLQILVKAHFYKGNLNQARHLISHLDGALNNQENSLPYSLESELIALQLRIQARDDLPMLSLAQLESKIIREESQRLEIKNDLAVFNVLREYHHRILLRYPDSLDVKKYLYFIDFIQLGQFNTYLTQADKNYLYQRAVNSCGNHSELLCQKIQLQNQNQWADTRVSINP